MSTVDVGSLAHRNAVMASAGKRAMPIAPGSIRCREESEECEKGPKVRCCWYTATPCGFCGPALEVASDLPSLSEATQTHCACLPLALLLVPLSLLSLLPPPLLHHIFLQTGCSRCAALTAASGLLPMGCWKAALFCQGGGNTLSTPTSERILLTT